VKIKATAINVRESFTITRKTDGQIGATKTSGVLHVPGEQPASKFVVPASTGAAASGVTADAKPDWRPPRRRPPRWLKKPIPW